MQDERLESNSVKIYGSGSCVLAFELRDFMQRSAIPFQWIEFKTNEEARMLPGISTLDDHRLPVCELPGGMRLYHPQPRDLAEKLGYLAKPKLEEYDLSIYGAGPAGLSAAVYAASDGLKTILIERSAIGGQAGSSAKIENYLGFPEGISGAELAERAKEQACRF